MSGFALVNLSFVFCIGYLIKLFVKKTPSSFEHITYFTAWFAATIINILQFYNVISQKIFAIILAFGVIILTITVLFTLKKITSFFYVNLSNKKK
ncbi:MAG: hypothetical protein KR126chlam4_01055 [Candidatus Anoxychlamydiales bacterium]|nr:hypothetical protein [Candidatus Anoxychlamydiales bacterium]